MQRFTVYFETENGIEKRTVFASNRRTARKQVPDEGFIKMSAGKDIVIDRAKIESALNAAGLSEDEMLVVADALYRCNVFGDNPNVGKKGGKKKKSESADSEISTEAEVQADDKAEKKSEKKNGKK